MRNFRVVPTIFLVILLAILLTGCPGAYNQPPIAIAAASPTSGEAPLTVNFDGSASSDPDGTISTYQWDFGDGSPAATGATQTHSYMTEDVFTIILTVTDNIGATDSITITINTLTPSIYFASDRATSPEYEIYRMDDDGGNQARVTVDPAADDLWPALLPNTRAEVAFASDRTGDFEIFKMTALGLLQANLTNQSGSNEIEPSWSPDGTKIAFASDQTGDWEIFIMDADGTDLTQLTTQTGSIDVAPAISPDGTKIAFAADCNTITVSSNKASLSDCGHDFEIFTMTIDGDDNVTAVAKLTSNTDNDGALGPNPFFGFGISTPSWSPDGTQIAFTSDRDGGDLDIFIMDADGSGVIQLTSSSADDYDPFWLPGGEEIAFVSDRDGGAQIFKIDVATKAVTQLTTSGDNVTPARER